MALSNSYDFAQNRDSLIKDSLVTAKVVRDDQTPTGHMNASAARLLNRIIKAWTVHGLQLWAYRDCLLFLESGKSRYQLSSSGDRWIVKQDAVETQLDGVLSASATSVTVDSTTGMSASDTIGIVTAFNTMHWDIISSVDSSTTLTLTTGVAAAAADDAYVVAYTSKAQKPYRITEAKIVPYATTTWQRPLNILSRNEWYTSNTAVASGPPTEIMYIPQLSEGILEVKPTPTEDNHYLQLAAHLPFDDVDGATDSFYFPEYWLDALHLTLAYRLYLDYGTRDPDDSYDNFGKQLKAESAVALQEAIDFDNEDTYIELEPELRWQR